jgi:enoyl-CoA hydratase/carnithine racemase
MISPTLEKARNEAEVTELEVVTERSGSILRVQMNRPAKKNAMTVSMYAAIAELLNDADKDDEVRVVMLHPREIPSPQATI